MARVLRSPSILGAPNAQNFRKKEKILAKGAFTFYVILWYTPNPGSKEIWSKSQGNTRNAFFEHQRVATGRPKSQPLFGALHLGLSSKTNAFWNVAQPLERSRTYPSRVLGRGCDEALFSTKMGFSIKGGRHSVNDGFGKDFYIKGKSVKRSGHSMNRRALKTEKLLSSSPSRKAANQTQMQAFGNAAF